MTAPIATVPQQLLARAQASPRQPGYWRQDDKQMGASHLGGDTPSCPSISGQLIRLGIARGDRVAIICRRRWRGNTAIWPRLLPVAWSSASMHTMPMTTFDISSRSSVPLRCSSRLRSNMIVSHGFCRFRSGSRSCRTQSQPGLTCLLSPNCWRSRITIWMRGPFLSPMIGRRSSLLPAAQDYPREWPTAIGNSAPRAPPSWIASLP